MYSFSLYDVKAIHALEVVRKRRAEDTLYLQVFPATANHFVA